MRSGWQLDNHGKRVYKGFSKGSMVKVVGGTHQGKGGTIVKVHKGVNPLCTIEGWNRQIFQAGVNNIQDIGNVEEFAEEQDEPPGDEDELTKSLKYLSLSTACLIKAVPNQNKTWDTYVKGLRENVEYFQKQRAKKNKNK